jgi:cyclopropane-fatty-acyl-phospholipid synthase
MHPLRGRVVALMEAAGIQPGGPGDCDPQILDPRFYGRVLREGSLGLGDAWMDGWWTVRSLDGMLFRLMAHGVDERVHGVHGWLDDLRALLVNLQAGRRALAVGERHYDLGNDLFEAMLGKRLVYSCGYWREAAAVDGMTLDDAQEAKLDLVCRKLGLRPGMRVLDIGCGWGEALKFAAERYGVSGVGVTISREQADYARALCAGLPVEIRLQDYHRLGDGGEDDRFDRIFSIGMFEHVGAKNYRAYFEVVRRCLKAPDDLFLLHCIGNNVSVRHTDPWIARHIFPNSMLPSARQVADASEGLFVMEDWHNFGADYDRTLQAWRTNIEAAWERLPSRYDERFRRMWRFYLAASMAAFRARRIQLWQVVFSPHGIPGGYVAPR